MTLTQHYRIIGILLLLAFVIALGACIVISLLMATFACDNPPNGDTTICFLIGGGFLLISFVLFALPLLWVALGVFRPQPKVRRRAMICAMVISVLFIPIGTVAGAYMFYVMLKLDPQGDYFQVRR